MFIVTAVILSRSPRCDASRRDYLNLNSVIGGQISFCTEFTCVKDRQEAEFDILFHSWKKIAPFSIS